jgi:hypothetical protein
MELESRGGGSIAVIVSDDIWPCPRRCGSWWCGARATLLGWCRRVGVGREGRGGAREAGGVSAGRQLRGADPGGGGRPGRLPQAHRGAGAGRLGRGAAAGRWAQECRSARRTTQRNVTMAPHRRATIRSGSSPNEVGRAAVKECGPPSRVAAITEITDLRLIEAGGRLPGGPRDWHDHPHHRRQRLKRRALPLVRRPVWRSTPRPRTWWPMTRTGSCSCGIARPVPRPASPTATMKVPVQ